MAQLISTPNAQSVDGQGILEYAGIVLQIVRTEEWLCEPDLDYSGVDFCTNHIILGVRAVVNPYATATDRNGNGDIVSRFGPTGNRAGVTMADLQQVLMNPRQPLIYRIGPDVVVSSPLAGAVCDAKNGPKPLACRILEVKGTKSAIIHFRIETWISGPSPTLANCPTVLSNRWAVEAHVDDEWKTTLITRGRMRVRTDVLQTANPATPDIFRGACLPLPVPDGFRRGPVDIVAREDGTELAWTVVDRQQSLNLNNGAALGVVKIEGHYTTGSQFDFKDVLDVIHKAEKDPLSLILPPVAQVRNSFYIKVTGPPPLPAANPPKPGASGSIRHDILQVALAVALDRFQPLLPFGYIYGTPGSAVITGGIVSLYATISIQDPCVELRGEVFGGIGQSLNVTEFGSYVNLKDDMTGQAPSATLWGGGQVPVPPSPFIGLLNFTGATGSNPNPPNGDTSRGLFVGALLEQALKGQFDVPASNAPSVGSADDDVGIFD